MNSSMRNGPRNFIVPALALGALGLLPACSGGGGSSGTSSFRVTAVNVVDGAIWRINRPIKISFNQPVDFSSVTLNSFNVRQVGGGPAAGEFYTEDGGLTVVFQPLCPTRDDLSDAGLRAGTNPLNNDQAYAYELNLLGIDKTSVLPVRAANGIALAVSQTRRFTTPVSTNPLNLYLDTKVGPPVANIERTDLPPDAEVNILARFNPTFIEVGGSTGTRHYFKSDGLNLSVDPPIDVPLNRLSDPASQVALIIGINQAVDPSSTNINSNRVRWEFTEDGAAPSPTWTPLTTAVTLESNCAIVGQDPGSGATVSVPGARLRVIPTGVLPPSADLRAVIAAEFSDIVGETNPIQQTGFAEIATEAFPTNPPVLVDHYLEDFDTQAFNDTTAAFAEPRADWQDGELAAKFSFSGTGGPGGNFDWYIDAGEIIIFNTANSTINGFQITFAPGSDNITQVLPIGNQTVVGGVVDVNDFYIESGGVLKVEGPNPFTLMASGRVVIRGRIDVSGTSSNGVNTLNVTNIPEPGAPGQAGGGKGGTGSPLTTASSPKGTAGYGAFNVPDLGGAPGHTGWSQLSGEASRRGGGGGGGVLGRNEFASFGTGPLFEQRRIGYDAEPGFNNSAATNCAIDGPGPAHGGAVAPSPFGDPDPNNNFFGSMFNLQTSQLILGELQKPWAGSGGGAGGDAARVASGTFPGPWNPAGDEKGSGGAGGGGSVQIMALGPIVFGVNGQLLARGGIGGGGENTIFLNRVGGGSGGGSGGHIVLQSSSRIDFRDKIGVNFANVNDNTFALDARGGQGGAGNGDLGGGVQSTSGQRETLPLQDACPPGYPTTGTNACRGQVDGAGGDGGPGLIQLHTSAGVVGTSSQSGVDIVLPSTAGVTLNEICAPPPLCKDNTPTTVTCKMIPTFGRTSRARSKWVALGEGGFNGSGVSYKDLAFAFAGIDPVTGLIQTDAQGRVNGQPPVLGPSTIDLSGVNPPYIVSPGGYQAVFDAAALIGTSNEALLNTPALLNHYQIELNTAGTYQRYDVVLASYNSGNGRLTLTIDGDGPSMLAFNLTPATTAALLPAYFRVNSSGAVDFIPASATVQIRFEATQVDPATGGPNSATIIGPTSNISLLNATPNGQLRFVRFSVLFDIAAQGQQLSPDNPIPALEFLRLPFSY